MDLPHDPFVILAPGPAHALSVSALESGIGCSSSYLAHLFREQTGESLLLWLEGRRPPVLAASPTANTSRGVSANASDKAPGNGDRARSDSWVWLMQCVLKERRYC